MQREGNHHDQGPTLGLFALTLFAYAYFFGGGGWNQNAILDLTRGIVERGTLWIDGYHRNTGDVVVVGHHLYANKPPGVSLLAAPWYWLLHTIERASGRDADDWLVLTFNAYVLTVLICGVSGALIAVFVYSYCRERTSRGWSMAIALTTGLGTPIFAYSTMLFVHVPSALLTLLAFTWSSRPGLRHAAAAGAAAGLNALCNFLAIPLVVIFALRTIVRDERPIHRLVAYCAGALPPLAIFAAYQQSVYGSILKNPGAMNPAFTGPSGESFGSPSLHALLGITVSPYRGLFFLSPVLIFGLAGLIVMFRRRHYLDAITICAVSAVFFGVNISFNNWNGGSAIGPRYVLPVIPLLGMAMSHVSGWWRGLWVLLAAVSLVNNVVATAVDPQVPITISSPLAHYEYPLLFRGSLAADVPIQPPWLKAFLTGHTSVNRQSTDEILPMIRHAPGSYEAEWASFNAGEWLFGPGSLWSLLPLILGLLFGSAALLRLGARATESHP